MHCSLKQTTVLITQKSKLELRVNCGIAIQKNLWDNTKINANSICKIRVIMNENYIVIQNPYFKQNHLTTDLVIPI